MILIQFLGEGAIPLSALSKFHHPSLTVVINGLTDGYQL